MSDDEEEDDEEQYVVKRAGFLPKGKRVKGPYGQECKWCQIFLYGPVDLLINIGHHDCKRERGKSKVKRALT